MKSYKCIRHHFGVIIFFLGFQICGFAQVWETLNANSLSWRFEDLFFVSPDTGWIVDGGGQILKTTDAGLNWTQQYYNPNLYFRAVEFFDEQIGFAGTLANGNPNATLLKTTDGGQNWQDISSQLSTAVPGICGIHMVNANTVFITGVFYGSAFIMKSTDQGSSWQYFNMSSLANGLVDIYFKDENRGWAVGQSPQGTGLRAVILSTNDGGQTWNQLASGLYANQRAWKIQDLDGINMYASIEEFEPSPQYFKSTDGGINWILQDVETTNTSGTMQGIGFLSDERGWIGGFNQLLYETTDGGSSWTYKPNVGLSFNRFLRVNDTLMYSAGLNVYRYVDPSLLSLEEFEITRPEGHRLRVDYSHLRQGYLNIELELVSHTYFELSVYNQLGQRVQTIQQGRRDQGLQNFHWKVDKLATGKYFLALYTYFGYQSVKVFIP